MLKLIKPEWALESRVAQPVLRYSGHVMREERGMENNMMLGRMSGKRKLGGQITRWLNTLNNMNINIIVVPPGIRYDSAAQRDNCQTIEQDGG